MRAGEESPRESGERGAALLVAVLVTAVVSSVALVLVLSTTMETLVAFSFRSASETFLAADAGIERALPDLAATADWSAALDGSAPSTFIDGGPGTRTLAGGRALNLVEVVNRANCGHAASCSQAEVDAVTTGRPWGLNNPRWRLYLHGALGSLTPDQAIRSPCYLVVLVADDPEENDNDPSRDGISGQNPGAGIVRLRSEAFGPGGAHSVIEATVVRPSGAAGVPPALQLVGWHELREPGG